MQALPWEDISLVRKLVAEENLPVISVELRLCGPDGRTTSMAES